MTDRFNPGDADFKQALRDFVKAIPRVFVFLWEVAPVMFSIIFVLMLISSFFPAAILWTSKLVLDGVVEAVNTHKDWTLLLTPIIVLFVIWLIQALTGALSNIMQMIMRQKAQIVAQGQLMEKAGKLDLAFFESPRFYDQLYHARRRMWGVYQSCFGTVTFIQQFITLGTVLGLLSVLHPVAVLVLVGTSLPHIWREARFTKKRYKLDADLVRADRLADYLARLVTFRDTAKEVRVFSLKDYFTNRYYYYRNLYLTAYRKLVIDESYVSILLNLLGLIGVSGIYIYAVMETVAGRITIGDLPMVVGAAQQSRTQLTGLISSGGRFYENSLFVTRFFQFLDLDPKSIEGSLSPPTRAVPLAFPSPITKGIEFKDVSFKYPQTDTMVLDNVSFTVPVGGKIAIVGVNGAGKTTMIKLLARLYDPTHGSVSLDGIDLREYDLPQLRTNISVVFQDFYQYDISASDNVGLGKVDEIDNRPLVEIAAQRGGVHETIDALPSKYDTILGRTFEQGVDLSGGEWQNMAIARAFMSDSQFLILDEPTAALDALKEHQLYERFSDLTEDKTVVFISHRFSTVRMADLIIVINGGRVTEIGSHQELLANGDLYSRMFNTQASRYVS
ncbi:MAG: ABC transporter ATP-binding protein [Gammaproteobacteria bacterium]|nr:ABC transporter ATP-binding protein [Gammaproteobacteria bacterium]